MPYPDQPKDTPIPPELDRWNWGAFLLNWIWGIGNSTYIALLMFVPLVNVIMVFVLGAKGSKWAWKNRVWENKEHFVRTQRNWARAGLAVIVAAVLLMALLFYVIMSVISNSDAYTLSLKQVKEDARVVEAMGEPIQPGWFTTGQIALKDASGSANLSIPISGPKCDGEIVSRSNKINGKWVFHLLVVKLECSATEIILIDKKRGVVPRVSADT